ncbi:MAG: heme ABC exporter ATP-binding protein CcmA [Solirubrobacterales bacterium]
MAVDGTGLAATAAPDDSAAPQKEPALALHAIVKRWRGIDVLDGVDLDVPGGTRVFIGGINGAGKTTLLRIAAGLIVPDSGEIALRGLDPERQRRAYQRKLGFLSAGNVGLYARLSVRDNVAFWAAISFVPRPRRRRAIDDALERFQAADLADRRVDRLSMGQRQRIRLAMTFLHAPEVVLLDEPHTSLDDDGLSLLGGVLDEHARAGGSALICAPSRDHLGLDVDASYVIDSGRLAGA